MRKAHIQTFAEDVIALRLSTLLAVTGVVAYAAFINDV